MKLPEGDQTPSGSKSKNYFAGISFSSSVSSVQ